MTKKDKQKSIDDTLERAMARGYPALAMSLREVFWDIERNCPQFAEENKSSLMDMIADWRIRKMGSIFAPDSGESIEKEATADALDIVRRYMTWVDSQMRFYRQNPQVCRTYHECLVQLQHRLGLPLTEYNGHAISFASTLPKVG